MRLLLGDLVHVYSVQRVLNNAAILALAAIAYTWCDDDARGPDPSGS